MKRNNSKRKAIIMTILAIVSLLVVIGSTYYIRNVKESVPTTRFESIINHSLPKPIKTHIANKELKAGEVDENLKRIDDVLVGLDKANLQTSPGANQLRLFLEKPWATDYLFVAFIVCLFFIFIIYIWRTIRRKLYNKWYWIMIPLIVLLAFSDISLHLDDASKNQVDLFFVFICFLSIGIAVIAIVQMLIKLIDEKFSNQIRLVRKEHRQNTLLWAAIAGWSLAYLCFFIGMYAAGTQKSALAAIFRPALSACKMFFLADSPADFSAALRLSGGFMGFYTIVKIFVLAVTASTLIWLILYRWKASLDIRFEQAEGKKLYVFFGITRTARILAKDIRAKEEDSIIVFVENRKENANLFNSVSFSSVLGLLRHRGGAYDMAAEVDAHLIISNVMMSSPECDDLIVRMRKEKVSNNDIKRSLGLKHFFRLAEWAQDVHCFFLYDDEQTNINGANNLRFLINNVYEEKVKMAPDAPIKLKIHCWARKDGRTQMLEIPDGNDCTEIKILDSSLLSVQSLMQQPAYHPVQFVNVDTNTASVTSRFESLIIGFGETGQDALKFLYEFGAFLHHDSATIPEKDESNTSTLATYRSPFHCDVVDGQIATLKPTFLSQAPAIKDAYNMKKTLSGWIADYSDPLVSFHQVKVGDKEYISLLENVIKKVNYVIIALGNDELNLSTFKNLMEIAVRTRGGEMERLKIFVRNYSNEYSDTSEKYVEYYNRLFANKKASPVVLFGQESTLFSYKLIVSDEITNHAQKYYEAYRSLKNAHEDKTITASTFDERKDPKWETRHRRVRDIYNKNYCWWTPQGIKRKELQDINNDLHKPTKLHLIGVHESNKSRLKELADAIEFTKEGKSFEFVDKSPIVKLIYTNLARVEHLRWNASHEMLGYVCPNPEKAKEQPNCNEDEKTHNCLVAWSELPDVTAIHNKLDPKYPVDYQAYDYLVVKTTFEMSVNNNMK